MSAATIERPKAKRAASKAVAPAPTSAYDQPTREEDLDSDDASLRLAHARSISALLCQIFGHSSGASENEIRNLEGLMGTVQHLRHVLADLHSEVMDIDGQFPAGFREAIGEASGMATLIDEVEWLAGYTFFVGDETMSDFFGAIYACCETASEALRGDGGQSA